MKKALIVSVLLNLLLLICLLAPFGEQRTDTTGEAGETNSTAGPEAEVETSTLPVPSTLPAETQGSESEVALAPVPARLPRDRSQAQPILMPLVFQPVDLATLKLNDEQAQAISDLQEKFLDEIGGAGQDPNDPAYREKWLRNQPEIDSDLRAMIGVTAFQNYQIEAAVPEAASHRAIQTRDEH
jgi:hypothetical protein